MGSNHNENINAVGIAPLTIILIVSGAAIIGQGAIFIILIFFE